MKRYYVPIGLCACLSVFFFFVFFLPRPNTSLSNNVPAIPVGGSGQPNTYPVDRPFSLLTAPSGEPKPAYLQPFTDVATGAVMVRISDQSQMKSLLGDSSIGNRLCQMYGSKQAWNSDDSLLMLSCGEGSNDVYILDGKTGAVVNHLQHTGSNLSWSYDPSLPTRIWQVWQGGAQVQYVDALASESTGAGKSIVHDWSSQFSWLWLGGFGGQSDGQDDSGRYVAFIAQDKSFQWYAVIWDRTLDTIQKQPIPGDASDGGTIAGNGGLSNNVPKNIWVSPTGTYVVVAYTQRGFGSPDPGHTPTTMGNQGLYVFPRANMSAGGTFLSPNINHPDIGWDTRGREVLYVQASPIGDAYGNTKSYVDHLGHTWASMPGGVDANIVGYRLDQVGYNAGNGFADKWAWFALTPQTPTDTNGTPIGSFTTGGMHISARNSFRTAYVYASATSYTPGSIWADGIFAVQADPTTDPRHRLGEIWAFARHHTTTGYLNESHATVSRDGLRLVFSSDWNAGNGEVDAYLVTMP